MAIKPQSWRLDLHPMSITIASVTMSQILYMKNSRNFVHLLPNLLKQLKAIPWKLTNITWKIMVGRPRLSFWNGPCSRVDPPSVRFQGGHFSQHFIQPKCRSWISFFGESLGNVLGPKNPTKFNKKQSHDWNPEDHCIFTFYTLIQEKINHSMQVYLHSPSFTIKNQPFHANP